MISVSKSDKCYFALLVFSDNKFCILPVGNIMLTDHMSYMLDGPEVVTSSKG
jgi:hypothetical protein